jgi:hypothetical protein
LGKKCCERFKKYNGEDKIMQNWWNIFSLINQYNSLPNIQSTNQGKTIVAIVSPGGWNDWDGETLVTKGLGGSETFSIKYSEHLAVLGYDVVVFCKCSTIKVYNNVTYVPVEQYTSFLKQGDNVIACIIDTQNISPLVV